jgi:hypothetical protein
MMQSSGAVFLQFAAAEAAGIGGRPPDARSPELDFRISIHESSHAIAGRALGFEVGGVTIEPANGFAGMTWGPRFVSALSRTDDDSLSFRDKICAAIPKVGEKRDESVAIVLQHALNHCVELCAGSVGEEMLLPGAPMLATDDLRQEVIYASLFTTSPASCEAFIALARSMAVDLLAPHKTIIAALAKELRIRRTMTGDEIDLCISKSLAVEAIKAEHARRKQWQRIEQNAAMFQRFRAS